MIFVYDDSKDPVIVRSMVNRVEGWSINVPEGSNVDDEYLNSEEWEGQQILFESLERLARWIDSVKAQLDTLTDDGIFRIE